MSERDTTSVTIKLDRQRPYRVRDEDRDAVWVGPGRVTVPAWVAEAWGATPLQADQGVVSPLPDPNQPPFEGYETLTVDEVIHRAESLSVEERAAIVAYELGRAKPRKTIIEELSA